MEGFGAEEIEVSAGGDLDLLFSEMAEACRSWLLAYTKATPSPSLCSDTAHERLIDAHNEVVRLVFEIENVFVAAPVVSPD